MTELYAYVVLVRPAVPHPITEVLEVSHLLGDGLANRIAVNKTLARMGEPPLYDTKADEQLADTISKLWLRARYNVMEGPFLVKSEVPIDADTMDLLVRDPEFMERLQREARI